MDATTPATAQPTTSTQMVLGSASGKRKVGLRTDPVWDNVIVDEGIVSCKRCEKIIHHMGKTHVERVRYHMEKKCIKHPRNQLIPSCFSPALSAEAIDTFQKGFALWFYSTGMAFNKISHPTLAAALSLLQPGSFVPTRQQLATSLLNSCYEDYRLRMAHELSGQPCTLTTDAWTDMTGKAVLNYVAICGEKTFFLESVYTGAVSHDAAFLASDIERVIHDYSWLTVSAVVTDNTPTNKLVWKSLQPKYPRTFFHGCASHVIHLAVKDLVTKLKWLNKLESDCRTVVRLLKKRQQLWYELRRLQKAEGKSALVLPADTRWGTIEKCFSSMLDSEEILFTFVSSRDFLKAKTKDLKAKRRFAYSTITARDFVKNLEKAVKIVSVLSKFQKAFERNTTPVSDVYDMFLQLPKLFEDIQMPITVYSSIVRVIQDRFKFVYRDAHGVAYLLDPRYAGVDMDADTMQRVQDFISSWHGPDKEEATSIELVKYHASLKHRSRELKLLKDKKITVHED
ncbi:uncharacterized protein IUM83_18617 [Phytophthora cinnamomi]|uniref:uncharacterized protein n=1 Tax=Phytophthora cinnamomi TaxID=4785 RepID=UPI00355A0688|nr:hypothetical protein IUM83_18617 [Phytophthora cinnamomi]